MQEQNHQLSYHNIFPCCMSRTTTKIRAAPAEIPYSLESHTPHIIQTMQELRADKHGAAEGSSCKLSLDHSTGPTNPISLCTMPLPRQGSTELSQHRKLLTFIFHHLMIHKQQQTCMHTVHRQAGEAGSTLVHYKAQLTNNNNNNNRVSA